MKKGKSKNQSINEELFSNLIENPNIAINNKKLSKPSKSYLYKLLFKMPLSYLALIPSIFIGCSNIIFYILIGLIVNELSKFSSSLNGSEVYDPLPKGKLYVIYMSSLALAIGFCKFFDVFLWMKIGSLLSAKVRENMFKSMMSADIAFYDQQTVGSTIKLLLEDSQQVQNSFGTTKSIQISNAIQFIGSVCVLYLYNWKLAAIISVLLPACALFTALFSKLSVKPMTRADDFNSKTMTIAEEALSSYRTVKSFNAEKYETNKYESASLQSAKAEQKAGIFTNVLYVIIQVIFWVCICGVLYYGAVLIYDDYKSGSNRFKIGDLIAFYGLSMIGYYGITTIQMSLSQESRMLASSQRIEEMINYEPTMQFNGGYEPDSFVGAIEFRNVSFKYPTRDQFVLKNVSFSVDSKQCIALVGHSGSGKSTCAQLLERFYDVTEGLILIDGKDIKDYNPHFLHQKIGLVSQDPKLFSTTIRENVAYGSHNASMVDIEKACEIANAKHFIEKLENKYETVVGEKGHSLSGGQRQRISIARAILKNPSILITDEATSSLDARSEKKVQQALDNITEGRTTVIIAHRLSTVKNAQQIYVFDSGEVVEQGTHNELIEKHGIYYNLFSKQLNAEDESK